MVLTATYPLYIVTGLLIWLPGVAFLSWMIHLIMAAMATPLILGHIFMATVNPDTRVGLSGMISGFVDRHWAEHHYRRAGTTSTFGHLHAAGARARTAEPVPRGTAFPGSMPRNRPFFRAVMRQHGERRTRIPRRPGRTFLRPASPDS